MAVNLLIRNSYANGIPSPKQLSKAARPMARTMGWAALVAILSLGLAVPSNGERDAYAVG